MFDSTMSFSPHINNIICKAIRPLNFVKINLYNCNDNTKYMAHTNLIYHSELDPFFWVVLIDPFGSHTNDAYFKAGQTRLSLVNQTLS